MRIILKRKLDRLIYFNDKKLGYLSIERVYYNFETCKNKVGEYFLLSEIKNIIWIYQL